MAKNQLVPERKKKSFTEISDIIKSPSSHAKLKSYIDEAVNAKIKILDQNEAIKGLRDSAVEELGLQPKMFNFLVSLLFNNNFDEKLAEIGEQETAIEGLMQTGSSAKSSDDE